MTTYSRHAFHEEIIYPQMMAELTGENPDNYRGRPFDADLFDYRPSGHQGVDLKQPAPAEAPRIVHPNGPAPATYPQA